MFEALDMAVRQQKTLQQVLSFKRAKGFVETFLKRYGTGCCVCHMVAVGWSDFSRKSVSARCKTMPLPSNANTMTRRP